MVGLPNFWELAKATQPGHKIFELLAEKAGYKLPDIDLPDLDEIGEFFKNLPIEIAKMMLMTAAPVLGAFVCVAIVLFAGKTLVEAAVKEILIPKLKEQLEMRKHV